MSGLDLAIFRDSKLYFETLIQATLDDTTAQLDTTDCALHIYICSPRLDAVHIFPTLPGGVDERALAERSSCGTA
jgi:hypothetical protein